MKRKLQLMLLLVPLFSVLPMTMLLAQQVLPNTWVPNGAVNTMTRHGDIIYIGGQFTQVARSLSNGVVFDISTGIPKTTSAIPNGPVDGAVSDQNGGFFISSNNVYFSKIGDVNRNKLAHILADGSVSQVFNPILPSGSKKVIAATSSLVFVDVGNIIYCIDFSGNIIWSRQASGGRSSGSRILGGIAHNNILYLVGNFTTFEGQSRIRAAALDVLSGALLDWNTGSIIPPLNNVLSFNQPSPVHMGISGNELFIRYRADNLYTSQLISVDLVSGLSTGFSMLSPGNVPMIVHGGRIYLSSLQQGLIILDATTKQVLPNPTSFNINTTNRYIRSIAANGNSIYLCGTGSFVNQTGESIGDVISFDATTQELLPFNTSILRNLNSSEDLLDKLVTIAVSDGNIFVGGFFSGINAVERSNVFAYNIMSGELLPFAPVFDEYASVGNLHASNTRLYVSGIFYQVNLQDRGGLASFDLGTGALTEWNPIVDCSDCLLEGNGETIYIANNDNNLLSTVNGNPRNGLAAFDAATGQLLDWSPIGMQQTNALVVGTSELYMVGVNFSPTTHEIRRYSISTGDQLFTPVSILGGSGVALAVNDEHIFVTGDFTGMADTQGQVNRHSFGAVSLSTGLIEPMSLDIAAGQMIRTVLANHGTIYLGGNFNQINNIQRNGLAAVNASTGQVTNWKIKEGQSSVLSYIFTIHDYNDAVLIGGVGYGSEPNNLVVASPDRSNVVTGTVFYDNNQNGVQDSGEAGVPNLLMELQPGNIFYPTDANGNYSVYTGIGNYTIRPVHPTYAIAVVPEIHEFNFSESLQLSEDNNFAIAIIPEITDLGVTLITDQEQRPGFYFNYVATYTNHGTVASNGHVVVTYDNRLLYQHSSIAPDIETANVLTYNFTNVEPGESHTILINMRVPVPTIEGSLLGEELLTNVEVITDQSDSNPGNNNVSLAQIVVGSVDPNDKLVTPQGHGPNGYIPEDTEHLEYTIRFQNVGTASAIFVTLEDVLDPNLDISTFSFVAASHPHTYEIVDRTLNVLFDNINLPDSVSDEPNSHGFFTFTIDLNNGLPAGTQIQNNASIVFDYNLPIVTNTVVNTLLNPPYETTIFFPDSTGVRNSEVLMPVFVNDWHDVLGAQFSVAWDNTVATFVGVESFGLPGMDMNAFNLSTATDGYFSFAWSDPTITAQSLPDTTALFYIRFNLSGDFGASTPVAITHHPVSIEVIAEDYQNLEVIRIDGVLTVSNEVTLQGTVQYSNDEAVQNVTIQLTGDISEIEAATDSEGQYELTFVPDENEESVILTPLKANDPDLLNGIDVQDVASIRRHILRTELFTNAHQVIAADLSNNSAISIQDVILLQALILGVETDLPEGRQWTFVDSEHTFTDVLSPFPYPQSIEVNFAEVTEEDRFDFTAIKLGDVTMDRDNTQAGRTKGQEVVLEISEPIKQEDGTYEVSVTTLGFVDISAYQFTITWDHSKLELLNVINESVEGVYGEHKVNEGFLTTIWDEANGTSLSLDDQAQLFKLRFSALTDTDPGLIDITPQLTAMGMFDNKLNRVEFSVRQATSENKASGNFYPNPFDDEINISFTLKEAQVVTIEILNDLGQRIGVIEDYYEKGWNEVKIDGSNFRKGLYLFSINIGGRREVSKLVKK